MPQRYFRALLCFLFLSISLQAQQNRYSATTGDVSLTAAGTALTIQQPAANARQVKFESAIVYCSVACNITQAQNGAAATATAGTATALTPTLEGAQATVWTASNVGAGTAIGPLLHINPGPNTQVIDLSKLSMGNTGANTNYTVSISSITGTANITIVWSESR